MSFRNPAVVNTYGKPKSGKTTDCLFSFPRALFLAMPGALKPSENVVGIQLQKDQEIQITTIPEATKAIKDEAQRDVTKRAPAVVVDDFSLLCENTLQSIGSKSTGWQFWQKIRDLVIEFRDVARFCGMHVVLNAHEVPPKTKNGVYVPGGPDLPGQLPAKMPAVADLVLRCGIEESKAGWKGVYRCYLSNEYVMGDRHGVTPDPSPMNIGEILRFAGYVIPRYPGLEWQEELVELGSRAIFEGNEQTTVLRALAEAARRKHTQNDLHIRWTLRDTLDRVSLRRARANILSDYGV